MRLPLSKSPSRSKASVRSGGAESHVSRPFLPFDVTAELSLATQELRRTLAKCETSFAPFSHTNRRSVALFLDDTLTAPPIDLNPPLCGPSAFHDITHDRSALPPGVPGATVSSSTAAAAAAAAAAAGVIDGTRSMPKLVVPFQPQLRAPLTLEQLRLSFCLCGMTITAGVYVSLERFSSASLCSSGPPNWSNEPDSPPKAKASKKKDRLSRSAYDMRLRTAVELWNDMVIQPSRNSNSNNSDEKFSEDPEELHERVMLVVQKEEEVAKLLLALERHRKVQDRDRCRVVRREEERRRAAASAAPGGRCWALPNSWGNAPEAAVGHTRQGLALLSGKKKKPQQRQQQEEEKEEMEEELEKQEEEEEKQDLVYICDGSATSVLRGLLQRTAVHFGKATRRSILAAGHSTMYRDATAVSLCPEERSVVSDMCENWAEYVLCEGDFTQLLRVTQQLASNFSTVHIHSNARTTTSADLKKKFREEKNSLDSKVSAQTMAALSVVPLQLLPLRLHFAHTSSGSVPSCTVSVDAMSLVTMSDPLFLTSHQAIAVSFTRDVWRMLQAASCNGILIGNLPRAGEVLVGVDIEVDAIVKQSQCRAVAMKFVANMDALIAHHYTLARAIFESFELNAILSISPSASLRPPDGFAPLPAHRVHYTVDVWQLYITAAAGLTESHDTLLPRLSLLRMQYPPAVALMYAARGESAQFSAAKALWDLEAAYSAGLAALHSNECTVLLYAEHLNPYAAFLRSDTALWGPVYLRSLRVAYAFCVSVAQLGTDAIPQLYRPLLRPVLHFVGCHGGQRELRQRAEEFLLELEERGKRVRMPLVRWDVPKQHRAELEAAAAAVAAEKCRAADVIACLADPADVLATPPPRLAALRVRYIEVPPLSDLVKGR